MSSRDSAWLVCCNFGILGYYDQLESLQLRISCFPDFQHCVNWWLNKASSYFFFLEVYRDSAEMTHIMSRVRLVVSWRVLVSLGILKYSLGFSGILRDSGGGQVMIPKIGSFWTRKSCYLYVIGHFHCQNYHHHICTFLLRSCLVL